MFLAQRQFIFLPATHILTPEEYGLRGYTTVTLAENDGTKIQAWYHPAAKGYPTVVYFHGNGGNMGNRPYHFALMTNDGYGLIAIDYRGYGQSEGSPSEEGFYADGRAAIRYATETLSIPPGRLILYGESIGTAVAVQMALETKAGGLVLQSPFTSMVDLAKLNYPWLPVSLLLVDRFDSIAKIGDIHMPLLLFHGDYDTVVPIWLGQRLFEKANEPKQAVYFPGRGHVDLSGRKLTDALTEFSRAHKLITK